MDAWGEIFVKEYFQHFRTSKYKYTNTQVQIHKYTNTNICKNIFNIAGQARDRSNDSHNECRGAQLFSSNHFQKR